MGMQFNINKTGWTGTFKQHPESHDGLLEKGLQPVYGAGGASVQYKDDDPYLIIQMISGVPKFTPKGKTLFKELGLTPQEKSIAPSAIAKSTKSTPKKAKAETSGQPLTSGQKALKKKFNNAQLLMEATETGGVCCGTSTPYTVFYVSATSSLRLAFHSQLSMRAEGFNNEQMEKLTAFGFQKKGSDLIYASVHLSCSKANRIRTLGAVAAHVDGMQGEFIKPEIVK